MTDRLRRRRPRRAGPRSSRLGLRRPDRPRARAGPPRPRPRRDADDDDAARRAEQEGEERRRAVAVLRRGLADSPELLRQGLRLTVLFAVLVAVVGSPSPSSCSRSSTRACWPTRASGPPSTFAACGGAAVIVIGVARLSRVTYVRLVLAAEAMLRSLRVRAFAHVHKLPMADHDATRHGELTARVTSDIETIARFAQYGGVAWIVDTVLIVGTLGLMAIPPGSSRSSPSCWPRRSCRCSAVMQRRQLKAYEAVRSRVGETLSEVSEAVQVPLPSGPTACSGGRRAPRRGHRAPVEAEMGGAVVALMFPLGDAFGGLALAAVTVIGVWWGPEWGLNAGGAGGLPLPRAAHPGAHR